jgi:hypothetical protein
MPALRQAPVQEREQALRFVREPRFEELQEEMVATDVKVAQLLWQRV